MAVTTTSHTSHWGAFDAQVEAGVLVGVKPFQLDADPSPILNNIPGSVRHRARIAQPMVRAGWLERGPGATNQRGADEFVAVSWPKAIELLGAELARVYASHGPEAVFGGSYGWSSAGRFHHAQGQLHRFLNCLGGYVASRNSYSNGALGVILPRVLGVFREALNRATTWPNIVEHTQLMVCFGGIPLKNTNVSPGGVTRHTVRDHLRQAVDRGVEFVVVSPVRDDMPDFVGAEWLAPRPGTDVALMLGLAHTLIVEGRHDTAFLARYCVGFPDFERYVLGADDNQPKTADWAATIADVPADAIRALARRMAAKRTIVNVTWSLQRAEFGEQAPWLAVVLAAMLGQIGLPGGGYGAGYGSMGYVGEEPLSVALPTLPQGRNRVDAFIPVARIADMLLNPGAEYDYDGERLRYPDIKLIYWAGGNPFHHHQDLNRLRQALGRVDTIVVHEPFWTPMARHADIVLPTTVTLERDDIGASNNDPYLIAMKRAITPFGSARDDYAIFADLAARLSVSPAFTAGRDEAAWLRHMYNDWRATTATPEMDLPDFDRFWAEEYLQLNAEVKDVVFMRDFRANPVKHRLRTPSGKIEITSATIAGFGYDDCQAHPRWFEPEEWLGSAKTARYPLNLVANNPGSRLHSQLDMGAHSQSTKVHGREPIRLHPDDAAARGIRAGDIVRVFNDRGSCLAGAVISRDVRVGVAQLSTGAWYDPLDPVDPQSLCVHGNPNVLTLDRGTSKLAQGCAGQHALVEVERWKSPLPPIRAYDPPAVRPGDGR